MATSCIRNNFAVAVSYGKGGVVYVQDQSTWMQDSGFTLPPDFTIEVYGDVFGVSGRDPAKVVLAPGGQGVLKLPGRLEGSEFPEGIFTFRTKTCGETFQTARLISYRTICAIEELSVKAYRGRVNGLELSHGYPSIPEIKDLRFMLSVSEAAARAGAVDDAHVALHDLKQNIKRYDCHCCP